MRAPSEMRTTNENESKIKIFASKWLLAYVFPFDFVNNVFFFSLHLLLFILFFGAIHVCCVCEIFRGILVTSAAARAASNGVFILLSLLLLWLLSRLRYSRAGAHRVSIAMLIDIYGTRRSRIFDVISSKCCSYRARHSDTPSVFYKIQNVQMKSYTMDITD